MAEPIVIRFTNWLLDCTLAHDPQWVACTVKPNGELYQIWNGITHAGLLPPEGHKAFGVWHPDGHEAIQRWHHSEAGKAWTRRFEVARAGSPAAAPVDAPTPTLPPSTTCLTEPTSSTGSDT